VKPWRRSRTRAIVFYLHLILGATSGTLLLILGVSGSVLLLVPERERAGAAVVSAESHRPVGISYDSRAASLISRGTLLSVRLPLDRGDAVTWRIAVPGGQSRMIRTDPDSGEELPPLPAAIGTRQWWHQLHGSLLSGATGRLVVGWLGLWLATLCVTGITLWWPGAAKATQLLFLRRRRPLGAPQLHHVVGIWLALPLAVLAITGSYFAFPSQYAAVAHVTSRSDLARGTKRPATTRQRASIDALLQASRSALPGGRPSMIRWTESGLVDVTVYRPGDWSPRGNNVVRLRGDTANIVAVDRFETASLGARVIAAMRPLHVGMLGGPLLRTIWVVAGLAPPFLFVTGLLMWWRRSLRNRLRVRDRVLLPRETLPSS
jgi:uncharacterized iron-regulated membrane protein